MGMPYQREPRDRKKGGPRDERHPDDRDHDPGGVRGLQLLPGVLVQLVRPAELLLLEGSA